MTAQGAVASVSVRIEPDVFFQKKPKCLLPRTLPTRRSQHRRKYGAQPAIFVTRETPRADRVINLTGPLQVGRSSPIQHIFLLYRLECEEPSSRHKFVVIDLFADRRNSRERRQIIGVALFSIELLETLVLRTESASDRKVLPKLDGEVVIYLRYL